MLDGIPGGPAADVAEIRTRLEEFRDTGLSPKEAAQIILDGVRQNKWRILVGPDAHALDVAVRANPEMAYSAEMADIISMDA